MVLLSHWIALLSRYGTSRGEAPLVLKRRGAEPLYAFYSVSASSLPLLVRCRSLLASSLGVVVGRGLFCFCSPPAPFLGVLRSLSRVTDLRSVTSSNPSLSSAVALVTHPGDCLFSWSQPYLVVLVTTRLGWQGPLIAPAKVQ